MFPQESQIIRSTDDHMQSLEVPMLLPFVDLNIFQKEKEDVKHELV